MSSLKKALEKLKPSHGGAASDSEKSGVKSPATPNGRAHSPAATPRSSVTLGNRPSGEFKRNEASSPSGSRTSIDQQTRGSLSGILHRRTESPGRIGSKMTNSTNSHHRSASLSAHSPMRAVKEKLHLGNDSSDDDAPLNRDGEPMSRGQLRKHEKQAQQEERYKQNLEKEHELEHQALTELTPEQRAKYGVIPPNSYAGEWKHEARHKIQDFSAKDIG